MKEKDLLKQCNLKIKCPPKLIATGDYRKMMEDTTGGEQKAVTFTDRFICAAEDIAKQNSSRKS